MTEPCLTVRGEKFDVVEVVAPMAFMRYSDGAVRGVDSSSPEGMAAMYVLLKACIVPEDWDRFEQMAITECLGHAELFEVVQQAFGVIAERPTLRPSESSDGPVSISPNSEDVSSSPAEPVASPADRVIRRLEEAGRPDWALVVMENQEYRAG